MKKLILPLMALALTFTTDAYCSKQFNQDEADFGGVSSCRKDTPEELRKEPPKGQGWEYLEEVHGREVMLEVWGKFGDFGPVHGLAEYLDTNGNW